MKCPKCLSDTAPTQLKKFGVCRVCQKITPEQLERVKQIITEQKETMESTWEQFQKQLQEPTLCGACGQYYEEDQQGDDGYHSAELCDANDEQDFCLICFNELHCDTHNRKGK